MATRMNSAQVERSFKHLTETYYQEAPARRFTAEGVWNKLIGLVVLTGIAGLVGALVASPGVAMGCLGFAFAVAMVAWFKTGWSKVLAPLYGVAEGIGLGAVSVAYSHVASGIVPLAVLFTAGVYVACLVAYRTGMVKVTPRLVQLAFVGAVGLAVVSVASLLGLHIPGLSNVHSPISLIFGVVCLAIAVVSLVADFAYVDQAARLELDADGEWFAAFAILTALVLVYISMLRVLAFAFGGNR